MSLKTETNVIAYSNRRIIERRYNSAIEIKDEKSFKSEIINLGVNLAGYRFDKESARVIKVLRLACIAMDFFNAKNDTRFDQQNIWFDRQINANRQRLMLEIEKLSLTREYFNEKSKLLLNVSYKKIITKYFRKWAGINDDEFDVEFIDYECDHGVKFEFAYNEDQYITYDPISISLGEVFNRVFGFYPYPNRSIFMTNCVDTDINIKFL